MDSAEMQTMFALGKTDAQNEMAKAAGVTAQELANITKENKKVTFNKALKDEAVSVQVKLLE